MSPQAGWILQDQVVPRLKSAIPQVVRCVGPEEHDELIQDATAMAPRLMDSNEKAGKTVTPGNVAYFTIGHIRSGRRSTGSSICDAVGTGTQQAVSWAKDCGAFWHRLRGALPVNGVPVVVLYRPKRPTGYHLPILAG
jgi:hypothetical protein